MAMDISEAGDWLQFRLQSSASATGRRGLDDAQDRLDGR